MLNQEAKSAFQQESYIKEKVEIINSQETTQPEIVELGEDDYLPIFLREQILKNWIVSLNKNKVEIVDFGCGSGNATALFAKIASNPDLYEKKISITGYDPHLPKMTQSRSRSAQIHFVDNLPKQADIVICNFSLHHTGEAVDDKKEATDKILYTLQEEINSLQPVYLAIAEADYQGPDFPNNEVGMKKFIKTFGSNDAGKQELRKFTAQDCYNLHRKFSPEDYLKLIRTAGYQIKQIINGDPNEPSQKYGFIITAEKADRK